MALLAAWVMMVFSTSAIIVLLGISGSANTGSLGLSGFIAATWRVADEVGPAVKLVLIAIFAILVLIAERVGTEHLWQRLILNMSAGFGAMLLTIGLVPEFLSRGFGIRLTGARFDSLVLPIYLIGGALGGIVFTISVRRCSRRLVLSADR